MKKRLAGFLAVLMLAALGTQLVAGDGTETLGPPSITIADGTDIIAAGTGTLVQPADINITIPAGATVNQVLLYWEGQASDSAYDDTVSANGNSVTGTLIGGPTYWFFNETATYRADITALGLVSAGANVVTITDMDFGGARGVNNGAGIIAIIDDGESRAIDLVDGSDVAFAGWTAPRDTTVPQTFTFDASVVARVATLDMFFSSVVGDASGFGDERPNSIDVTVDGTTTTFTNLLDSNDGDEWDTLEVSVNVPAGATSLTVQAFSRDDEGSGNLPASLVWIAAGLTIDDEEDRTGEGCTPGYWKQPHHLDSWVNYDPSDDYETVFGVDASFTLTLLDTMWQGGGKEKALGRHAVAALLNASNPDVDYDFTEAEVINMVQQAYATGNFNKYKGMLADANESGCTLN